MDIVIKGFKLGDDIEIGKGLTVSIEKKKNKSGYTIAIISDSEIGKVKIKRKEIKDANGNLRSSGY